MKLTTPLTVALAASFLCISPMQSRSQSGPPPFPPVSDADLNCWPLVEHPWKSLYDDPAMAFTNLNVARGWYIGGSALSIDTNVSAFLQLPVYETDWTNISLTNGSLEIWCQANWTSTADGGSGPGSWATLWDIGSYTRNAFIGAWLLAIDPSGSNLVWVAQSGGSNQVLWTPIDFDSGDWHQLVATWSSTNSAIYVDGALATNSGPILYAPSTAVCATNCFCVGSICAFGPNAGTNQFHGQLQWLESFSYPLTSEEIASEFASLASYMTYYGFSVPGSGISLGGGGGFGDDLPSFPDGTNSDGGTNSGGGTSDYGSYTPPAPISDTNYTLYNDFYLTITNIGTNAYVSVCNTLSNLNYIVLTNGNMANTSGWSVWQTLLATNSITPAPPINLTSNPLYFNATLVWSSCTNYSPPLPDWWAMLYFNSTACVNPAANPAGDGIDNWNKYLLGLNPNIAYLSQILFNPPGGNYTVTPAVTLFSLSGAGLKYTTSGSIPGATNGISIASGVTITNLPIGSFTLKAWESGLTNPPASATYTIIPATPMFSLPSGTYATGTTVQISSVTSNVTVYYTTNGATPTTSSPEILPTNILTLTSNETIMAVAYLGTNASPIASANYIIQGPPTNDNFTNAIVLSGASGQFSGTTVASTVEAFETNNLDDMFFPAAEDGTSVWYKWTAPSNGTVFLDFSQCNPAYYQTITVYCFSTNSSSQNPTNLVVDTYNYDYTSETFPVTNGIAYYISISDYYPGPFDISWRYSGDTDPPILSPGTGTYTNAILVTVSDNDTNAAIYYTTNGTSPTTNSIGIVSGSTLLINTNETLKAAAWRLGLTESTVTAATYTINPASTNPTLTASAPIISPTNEDFASSLTVTLTCTNAGGEIFYTLDGSQPTTASASVASGGTVVISNSAIVNAVTWVTNMNLSPVTTGLFAKDGEDTTGDGIPDTGALAIGANFLVSDATAINPNPFAHGLNNLQVYQNQSVLIADNYSTENDGIPDWWLVKNGFSVTTPASALGANGQTLLASYTAGLNPNNPASQPGQTGPIDFHMVHGPTNSMVMVLDTVRPNMAIYRLICWNTDQGLPAISEDFQADQSIDQPGLKFGRFFQMTNNLTSGMWLFTLQGENSNQLWTIMSSNTFERYQLSFYIGTLNSTYAESGATTLYAGLPVPVLGYTNNNSLKEPLLTQILRATSDVWQYDNQFLYSDIAPPTGPVLFDTYVKGLVTEQQWGTLTFECVPEFQTYYPIGLASYFPSICETLDAFENCDQYYSNYYGELPDIMLAPLEITTDGSGNMYFVMTNGNSGPTFNPAGLEYLSLLYRISNNAPININYGYSNNIPSNCFTFEVALDTETNTFQTTNFYFDGRPYPINMQNFGNYEYYSFEPGNFAGESLLPMDDFIEIGPWNAIPISVTNPIIVAQVGRPVNLQTWETLVPVRQDGTLLTNQICYVDQDFAQAYLCDPATGDVARLTNELNYNGKFKIDTNSAIPTGILSPNLDYPLNNVQTNFPWRSADFTPTKPGKVIVTTMPDVNGYYGEVTIYVIDMQADANHDGVMDNRDLTSTNNPMQFWVNNDLDRWHSIDYGTDSEQDDLQLGDSGIPAWAQMVDSQYKDAINVYAIPSTRDLEDYARLWMPGLSNLMAELPPNYGVNLQWRNNSGAGIRVFVAAETNGGTNYLFDDTTASNQVDETQFPCIGFATPAQTISLNAAFTYQYGPKLPGDDFIFCGTAIGNDELVLEVTNQYGGEVGEASVFLNLQDIKQMYERWSIGEYPQAPSNIATNCGDQGVPSFEYPYDSVTDINTPYILHVHGSNMETWEKDRFAETMYKRLYWQGYQGRFGSFRWPTDFGFNPLGPENSISFFSPIEQAAWQSAVGLKNLLTRLNILYPGQVQLSAHSMGNIAVGEALRQAATTLVQTYTAFQGNVPAQAYDTNAPTLTVSPDAGEPNVYAHYWNATNAQYFAGVIGAARYVNFFNTNDFVLNYWLSDQQDKPVAAYGYGYSAGQYYDFTGTSNVDLYFPTNTYQIFSFCQQAKCNCIGEQVGLGGVFLGNQVDLFAAPYSFGLDHKGHSAEFRSDNMSRAVFWNQVLVQMRLKLQQ